MKAKKVSKVISTKSVEVKKMSDYKLKKNNSSIELRDNNSNELVCTITDVVLNEEALSLIKCLIQTKIKKDNYSIKQLKRKFKKTHKSKFSSLQETCKEIVIEEPENVNEEINDRFLIDFTPILCRNNSDKSSNNVSDWHEPDPHEFMQAYPKENRSSVKRITADAIRLSELTPNEDFTIFEDFVNVEFLQIQSCHFESLNGIEKLKKLKMLSGGMNNHFSDLNPLRGLPLTYLDIEWTKVKDISPLIDVQTLEFLNLNLLDRISDYSVLFKLPNLKTVIFSGWIEVKAAELKDFLMKNYNTDENGLVQSSLQNETMNELNNHSKDEFSAINNEEHCFELPF